MDKYSFLNAVHSSFFEQQYLQYLENPDSIEPSWRAFFQGYDFGTEQNGDQNYMEPQQNNSFQSNTANGSLQPNGHAPIIVEEPPPAKTPVLTTPSPKHPQTKLDDTASKDATEIVMKEFQVINLINDYRTRGHLFTKTNPVRKRRAYFPSLDIENFGLTKMDLRKKFKAGEMLGIGTTTLEKILEHLESIYCEAIGIEYVYLRSERKTKFIEDYIHQNENRTIFTANQKIEILKKLNQAVAFESFLHRKYVGEKRFSLEGGESLIAALDAIIETGADSGVIDFVVGMAHRGRLNVLANVFGKPPKDIFNEFEQKDYQDSSFDGDVKYHLGWTSNRLTKKSKRVNLTLAPNPSHLESVGSIVQGIARSKIDKKFHQDNAKVVSIVIHGDAAVAGQGLAYELIQMEKLKGYQVGGTIHIIVNNQIGFTTDYQDGRSSTYCTDIAKVTQSLVLHVNADNVEAVVHAAVFATKYRDRFQSDVFIDLLGYRKYGHNEGDEPRFTQPQLYKVIAKHPNPKDIYVQKLIRERYLNEKELKSIEHQYETYLSDRHEDSRKDETGPVVTAFMENEWKAYQQVEEEETMFDIETGIDDQSYQLIGKALTKLPEDTKFLRQILRLIKDRKKMLFESHKIDWATAEHLAYGSLLLENHHVRISGQDVERGTFSHRHAIIKSEEAEIEIIQLNEIKAHHQGTFNIYNSLLSEYGVLGFEYGYALNDPNTLTIWEAQFGDFANGAQIIIDQYLTSAEAKWKVQNGLVLYLPHGYEGQGAEHSSGRIERFLQLCARGNICVANCSTPANFFHLLRRQMKVEYRKPLIIFTPKSLLRHPLVISDKSEFLSGHFKRVIPDELVKPSVCKTLVFCMGKFYYDLLAEREKRKRFDVALVRLEQIYPLPKDEIRDILEQYHQTKDIVWAQEEPRNMGVWAFLLMRLEEARNFRPVTRRFYSSTASGNKARYSKRQNQILSSVFDSSIDIFALTVHS
ncbi:MAG: 2-oxoglutarate dehydrogenase E1 component [Flavobacteriaceae bacterium]|nr:2-oxoglutarate dehydrogenase E1 component [Flavobacteriaceae bacterium]MCY4253110.1 2-oxoglutarate dehydrogenase E1 component [Flavobacteriaceae bacterium]